MSKDVSEQWQTPDDDIIEKGGWFNREYDTNYRIIVKAIFIGIILGLLLAGAGYGSLLLCQILYRHIHIGIGFNSIVPYSLLFSYIVCALMTYILTINKYLEHKFAYMGIPKCKKSKKKNFGMSVLKIFTFIVGIPYTILSVAVMMICVEMLILTFMGYPLLLMFILFLGVSVCLVSIFILVVKYIYYTDKFYKDKDFVKKIAIAFAIGFVVLIIGIVGWNMTASKLKANEAVDGFITTDTINIELPSEPFAMYYKDTDKYADFNIVEDDSVTPGNIKLNAVHSKYISDVKANVVKDYYLLDKSNNELSEHRIYFLDDLQYDYTQDSNAELINFMNNLKNGSLIDEKEINNITVEIKINPSDKLRLVHISDNQQMITYKEYTKLMEEKSQE